MYAPALVVALLAASMPLPRGCLRSTRVHLDARRENQDHVDGHLANTPEDTQPQLEVHLTVSNACSRSQLQYRGPRPLYTLNFVSEHEAVGPVAELAREIQCIIAV
jgi:hypothetical protein